MELFIILLQFIIMSLPLIAIIAVVYFLIKRLIRFNAEVKKEKTPQQDELDKMNINDL